VSSVARGLLSRGPQAGAEQLDTLEELVGLAKEVGTFCNYRVGRIQAVLDRLAGRTFPSPDAAKAHGEHLQAVKEGYAVSFYFRPLPDGWEEKSEEKRKKDEECIGKKVSISFDDKRGRILVSTSVKPQATLDCKLTMPGLEARVG